MEAIVDILLQFLLPDIADKAKSSKSLRDKKNEICNYLQNRLKKLESEPYYNDLDKVISNTTIMNSAIHGSTLNLEDRIDKALELLKIEAQHQSSVKSSLLQITCDLEKIICADEAKVRLSESGRADLRIDVEQVIRQVLESLPANNGLSINNVINLGEPSEETATLIDSGLLASLVREKTEKAKKLILDLELEKLKKELACFVNHNMSGIQGSEDVCFYLALLSLRETGTATDVKGKYREEIV